jgi:SSS family solute:Na+ symporter
MDILDGIVFFIYMFGVLGVGVFFYKKNKTSTAFTLGNNNIPNWVITLSFFATFVSSISYLALPGAAYLENWNPFVFSLSLPIAAVVAIYVFVPLYRRVNSPSAYTYLEERFGGWARTYASTMYLLTQLMRIGTILYLMALTLNAVFGWDIALVIGVTGIAVMIYSTLGGIQAVVWTDAIQAIILIGGAVVCVIYIFFEMPEGPRQVFDIASANDKFSFGSFGLDLSQPTFWVVLVYGIFINLQNYGVDQNYVQRYMIAKTEKDAQKAAFWGGMLYIPVSLLFLFIGTALFAFYQSGAASLPPELQDVSTADRVFPYFIVNQLPAGLTGLLIASIFAAGMSTISTSFNSAATVFLTDYYQKYTKTEITDQQKMRVLYAASVVISIIGIAIGIAMINVKSALDTWWKLASIFSGGILGLFLLGVFSKTKNVKGALIGVLVGLIVILWLSTSEMIFGSDAMGAQLHTYLTVVIGTTTIFIVGLVMGMFLNSNVNHPDERMET